MAHCPPELLDDLDDVLAELRTLPHVVEKTRGVFYLRREPFLHFHLLAGERRRADVKGLADWVQLDMPRPATATARRALLRELRRQHAARTVPTQRRRAAR
jgi:hypothetical protein